MKDKLREVYDIRKVKYYFSHIPSSKQKMVNVLANILETGDVVFKYNKEYHTYNIYELDTFIGELEYCDPMYLALADYIMHNRIKSAIKLSRKIDMVYDKNDDVEYRTRYAILWYRFRYSKNFDEVIRGFYTINNGTIESQFKIGREEFNILQY
jgi:hypothetical protein